MSLSAIISVVQIIISALLVAAILISGSILYAQRGTGQNIGAPNVVAQKPAGKVTIDLTNAMILGDAKAPVTIVEYADFQCSACGLYYPIIKNLEGDFKNDLKQFG